MALLVGFRKTSLEIGQFLTVLFGLFRCGEKIVKLMKSRISHYHIELPSLFPTFPSGIIQLSLETPQHLLCIASDSRRLLAGNQQDPGS